MHHFFLIVITTFLFCLRLSSSFPFHNTSYLERMSIPKNKSCEGVHFLRTEPEFSFPLEVLLVPRALLCVRHPSVRVVNLLHDTCESCYAPWANLGKGLCWDRIFSFLGYLQIHSLSRFLWMKKGAPPNIHLNYLSKKTEYFLTLTFFHTV